MTNGCITMLPLDPLAPASTDDPRANVKHGAAESASGRLEQSAQLLASQHLNVTTSGSQGQQPLSLPELGTRLVNVYERFSQVSADALEATYAAEWILDNYSLLDQTYQEIESDLPPGYYRQLPLLAGATYCSGYPRVLALARCFAIHEECHFDGRRLARFVTAYQQQQPLTMGEIWALPIMLRFVLLAGVVQAGERITGSVSYWEQADDSLDTALDLAHLVNDNEVIAHSIPSLRLINSEDWNAFFEQVSLVQQVLCEDPARLYAHMDFATRDRYRNEIETIARAASLAELFVAQAVVDLAQAACPKPELSTGSVGEGSSDLSVENLQTPRRCHVGYYLLAEGRATLEHRVDGQPSLRMARQRWILAHPSWVYFGSISLLVTTIVAISVAYAAGAGGSLWLIGLAGLLALIPAITLAVDMVNWVITRLLPPTVLPKLDFTQGIPPSCRTMIVVPALIAGTSDVQSLLNQMELHYLRNPDPNLGFALLSDYADAPEQTMPEDAALLAEAEFGIAALNQQYPNSPFYLFHRRRLWNPAEGTWMGWERKRGKLHEFNRLLRGDPSTSHTAKVGDLSLLSLVHNVITLDADTILPREQAQRLIGTLAHPLNRAQFDLQSGKVVAGYSVLQPRTEIKPMSANQSLFTRVFAGDVGIDLYSRAVSDLYQDLFGAGSYVGKGIYAVDAFEQSLAGRVPENSLLSHDLFEGMHGRAGLVTDVVLYEDYPPHYLINIQRSHRWVRGDWQLLPWLLPWTPRTDLSSPHASGQSTIFAWERNDLTLIDRWKIADNLRRSLLAPALLLLLLAGWTILPGSALLWTLLASLIPMFAIVTGALSGMARAADSTTNVTWHSLLRPLRDNILRWSLFLAFLPHETLITFDAIGRTLVRLLFTRRYMLQWTTAANAVRLFGENATAGTTLSKMLPSILLVLVLTLLVGALNIAALPIAAPYLVIWLLASQIAYWISRPAVYTNDARASALSADQRRQLRVLAQRTWLFYERFVGPDDHWLPPDHYQETPRGAVAHRTSPTNIGLYLVSVLAARDLGYIGLTNLSLRLRFAFGALDQLVRYRGHFLNWIDTATLTPLPPGYVSTVDSGNLAACLIVLKQGCAELPQKPVWEWMNWQGLLDLLALPIEAAAALQADPNGHSAVPSHQGSSGYTKPNPGKPQDTSPLSIHLEEMQRQILAVREDSTKWLPLLSWLVQEGQPELNRRLVETMEAGTTSATPETLHEWRAYIEQLQQRVEDMQSEIDQLLPWLALFQQPPTIFDATNALQAYPAAYQTLCDMLPASPTLGAIPAICIAGQLQLQQIVALLSQAEDNAPAVESARRWCDRLAAALIHAHDAAQTLLDTLLDLSNEAERYVAEMDFSFLFAQQRQVFHIGYNIDTGQLDDSYYDLLASEARIASIVAIAKNDVPYTHWLHLGRPLTRLDTGEQVLLSWSGTMFEYLMPPLLMHTYPDTLLDQSYHAVIQRQIEYGKQRGVPWGISESGFYAFDAAKNYQYHAFGAPGLGYQRGLSADLVIAPYASLLALPFAPQATLVNLTHLRQLGLVGRYGFYEAVDFTPARLQFGEEKAIVRSYMAHHQGMVLLALAASLQGPKMADRFHAEQAVQGVEMLLQEQIPRHALIQYPQAEEPDTPRTAHYEATTQPWRVPIETPMPLVHFLSNGRYGLMVTNAGGGYSRWGEIALTRWRADTTLDDWGCWLYVQEIGDSDSNTRQWSIGRRPTGSVSAEERVIFHPHKVEMRRRDFDIALHMEITVAPDDDVEIRRIHVSNESDRPRRLQLTTYGEVVLAPPGTDQRHPAFTKLFVESEYIPALNALLFRRRPRAAEERPICFGHMVVFEAGQPGAAAPAIVQTNRAQFLGRGHTPAQPAALCNNGDQAPVTGATLDPIMALGHEITVPPRTTVRLTTLTLVASSRTELLTIASKYQTSSAIDRAFTRASDVAARELSQLALHDAALEQIQQLLSLLLYPHAALRADAATLAANRRNQSDLWGFGISGDNPILLLQMNDETQGELLKTLLQAHTYWRRRGLQIDLVILNRQATNYGQPLTDYTHRMIRSTTSESWLNQRGGIFLLREDQLHAVDRTLLQTAARVILTGTRGSLAQQLAGLLQHPTTLPPFAPALNPASIADVTPLLPRPTDLQFDNGLGGFSADGREYVIYLRPGDQTPVPWINVIANPDFGFLVSERGGGYTWAVNSGENRLTPWQNDPVCDRPGEVIYLRDEETGDVWSPTPALPAETPYLVRHGAGYSIFEHNSHNLEQQVRLFTATDAPIKIIQIQVKNSSPHPRRLTVTYYAEWVLGVDRESTQQYIVPEYDGEAQALLARNSNSIEFGERVAFLAGSKPPHSLTADRTEFLGHGPNGVQQPAGLARIGLTGQATAGVDPCGALQLHVDLPVGGTEEVYFLLGQGADLDETLALVRRFQNPAAVVAAWQANQTRWDGVLGAVSVTTPDPAMNVLLNRWLLYQTLACRIWGRSALYQSSGAFGFRDQLQDVLALVHTRPDLAREQILRAAGCQFTEGDVLHWWHPPSGRGVRTRISDDLLWLPYVTAHYVATTGDTTVLQEEIPFLHGEPLEPNEEERYGHFQSTATTHTLYEHCRRALSKGTTAGPHGLPLMGGGDWNDGMNRVGMHGQGESIWLGWFLHATLTNFAALCEQYNVEEDGRAQAAAYREQADMIRLAAEANGWDGAWYRRAYYDDGTPLGSAENRECQIDSIAQSWAVLSGAAEPERARLAMHAALTRLVQWDDGLLLLFTPPFDMSDRDPGYIKGYVPGIRENGGQYTHAALWAIWAVAELGDGDLAAALFRLVNPIYHSDTAEKMARYQVEPYVVAADVYSVSPHVGRGGWTWYTGSSGWMYRLGIEAILGLRRRGDTLRLTPCIPTDWPGYTLTYRFGTTTYAIQAENDPNLSRGEQQMTLNGEVVADGVIPLRDDGRLHEIHCRIGQRPQSE